MNSMRSLVRQAAKPLAYNSFAKRTISSSRAALSDALFVVNDRHILFFTHTILIYNIIIIGITENNNSIVIHPTTIPKFLLSLMPITKSASPRS
jgi:hypothetical protein